MKNFIEDDCKITKEDLKEAFSSPIKISGMALKGGVVKTIKEKYGEKALETIEEESKNLEVPLALKEIKELEWYPVGIYLEFLYILQEKFNFKKRISQSLERYRQNFLRQSDF